MSQRFLASALAQHEAAGLYRLMVAGIRDVAVFPMNPNGVIAVWNREAQDIKGFTADEAIGSHLSLLYTDQDREPEWPRHNLAKAAENGVYSEETWRKRKDGSLFWAHIALTALTALRGDDTCGRQAGVDEAMAVAQKILDASTISVEEAMRRADHACDIARDRGRNCIYVHYKGDLDFVQRRSDMHSVTRLTHAFPNEQLQLYYQPILPLDDGDGPRHDEILLRMRNGRNGPVAPGVFLPAWRYDVIVQIDRWVLTRTWEWLGSNPEHTEALDMCSINLSRRALGDPSVHKLAAELTDASEVPADKLCFEISDNGAIADMQKTIADYVTGSAILASLAAIGVDFAQGYWVGKPRPLTP